MLETAPTPVPDWPIRSGPRGPPPPGGVPRPQVDDDRLAGIRRGLRDGLAAAGEDDRRDERGAE